jgi:5-formyltetrahydrofolate cyclo-ligase
MAWDVQEVPELPTELHDMRLSAIVTPTRVLGPF